jgi:hypothetical protein
VSPRFDDDPELLRGGLDEEAPAGGSRAGRQHAARVVREVGPLGPAKRCTARSPRRRMDPERETSCGGSWACWKARPRKRRPEPIAWDRDADDRADTVAWFRWLAAHPPESPRREISRLVDAPDFTELAGGRVGEEPLRWSEEPGGGSSR